MPGKKKAVGLPDLPKYVESEDVELKDVTPRVVPRDPGTKLTEVIEVVQMLARQSGVAEIREKAEALKG